MTLFMRATVECGFEGCYLAGVYSYWTRGGINSYASCCSNFLMVRHGVVLPCLFLCP